MEEAIANAWVMVQGLMGRWWSWVALAVFAIGIWYMYWRLFACREYKWHWRMDGKLSVRHGSGEWVDLVEHMKQEHPDEWEKLHR